MKLLLYPDDVLRVYTEPIQVDSLFHTMSIAGKLPPVAERLAVIHQAPLGYSHSQDARELNRCLALPTAPVF